MTTVIYKTKSKYCIPKQLSFLKLQLCLKNYQDECITNNYRTGLGK
jgi:hypothetical protein